MKVFTCVDHDYHWPVGVASVVVADSDEEARRALDAELVKRKLRPSSEKPYTLQQLAQNRPLAVVLCDGEY